MPKRKLTDMFIRNLTPPEKTTIWWDEVQPGLGVRVTPKDAKSWKVQYRHRGRLRWFHIDKFPAVGLKDVVMSRQVRFEGYSCHQSST